jgi:hypothetical protein
MAHRILLGLVLATGCITSAERVATTLRPVPFTGHLHVHILADDGSVRVSTADVAQVEMQVVSSGYDLERDLDLSMTPHGDRVDIVAKTHRHLRLFDFGRRSLRLEVRIPRDADVEISSGDGSVEVDAITGSLDVATGDGSIAARGARGNVRLHSGDGSIDARDLDGKIDASTGDGKVSVRGARGNIRLHSGDGSIDGGDLDGNVDASSGDGNVRLAGRFDALTVHTSDGKLVANVSPGSRMMQPWHLETGDGNVVLELPRELGARIEASTDDGHVTSTIPLQQLGKSHVAGEINGGGPPIVVSTGDGSIQLSQL